MCKKMVATLFCLACSMMVFAQNATDNNGEIITVEQAYLNSIEGTIIKEMAFSENKDAKLGALQYIENALKEGRLSDEIQAALNSLATGSITKEVRENGRVMNNYPEVRMEACKLLAQIPTEKSKDALIRVMFVDNEPAVVSAAVKSLGEIGINNNDETVNTINWINRKFATINPTSSLAMEILQAYEKLAPTVTNKSAMIEAIVGISTNYDYITPVRQKAIDLLKQITNNSK